MGRVKTDIEIAHEATMEHIVAIGEKAGIPESGLETYGRHKAKISHSFTKQIEGNEEGKLILVTAISPTVAGEGKTTTTIALGDGLNRSGHKTMTCIREASLGPCFGMKGGAAGGGYAQVVPMEDINLHFTGDFHAITSANNLLASMIDNHIHWKNELNLDVRRISWRRVMDLNDRALRSITCALGGVANGFPREAGFDITAASEVMAVLCLSVSLEELERRLGNMVIGQTRDRELVRARDLGIESAMTVLLKDAFMPNLVQSLENNPVLVHGGPFANIAHGCNSLVATRSALKLSDYVVTEAGFGADLGAEKFYNIKCRIGGLKPAATVLVATARALKLHGGIEKTKLDEENVRGLCNGLDNLGRHIRNLGQFGVPIVVAINRFTSDTDAEVASIVDYCRSFGVEAIECTHWESGSEGALELSRKVVELADSGVSQFRHLYDDHQKLWEKVETIALGLYGADEIVANQKVRDQFKQLEAQGLGHLPVCIAKTQYSFSTDPDLKGAPDHHVVPIREVRLSAGAGFVVVLCGDIMTMPGLPREPAALDIRLNDEGVIEGLT